MKVWIVRIGTEDGPMYLSHGGSLCDERREAVAFSRRPNVPGRKIALRGREAKRLLCNRPADSRRRQLRRLELWQLLESRLAEFVGDL